MSLRAIVECAVHVDTFRNIDLFQQGLYHVRVTVSQEINGEVRHRQIYPAQPYDLKFLSLAKETVIDSHHITQSRILDPVSAYCSNSFLVKYCDEEVRINDICLFRAEVYLGPHFHCYPLDISVQLMFLEASVNTSFERFRSMDVQLDDFTEISVGKLMVHNPCFGVHEFYTVLFDEMHFSTIDVVVHTALLDYRFRPTPLQTPKEASHPHNAKLSDQSIDLEITLAEYLFPGSSVTKTLTDEEIDKVHRAYVSLHGKGRNELRTLLLKLRGALPQADQELLPEIPDVQRLQSTDVSFSTEASEDIVDVPRRSANRRPRYSQTLATRDPEAVSALLMAEVHEISAQMCELYHALLHLCQHYPKLCISHFRTEFHTKINERYGESIFRDVHRVEALPLQSDEDIGTQHAEVAKTRRNNPYFQALEPLPIEDARLIGKPESLPVLFEDAYMPLDPPSEDHVRRPGHDGHVVFVLVHGFQGNSFDMRLFKNHICLLHPTYLFLLSSANEDNTEGDIIDMGLRLATEVRSFIQEWCPNNTLKKLSFIGHSLGGLIIRASLPFLSEYEQHMDLFMTLSTPHLGYMYSDSRLVDAGLWLLKKWKKSLCLHQLSIGDAEDTRESTIYRMSAFEGLSWFRFVVLFSSAQDQYAPFDSARIEVSSRATKDSAFGPYYIEMASKLLSHIGTERLKRIDVNFRIEGKSMDSMIGRKAHIEFLENQILMKIIVFRYPELFA